MPLSTILHKKCPTCHKIAKEVRHVDVPLVHLKILTLECGHTTTEKIISAVDRYNVISEDNKSLYPFQVESVKFGEASNGRCLFAHEMGLGKTVIALALLKLHPELFPVVILCKSSLKFQWFQEVIRWLQDDAYLPQIIDSSNDKPYSKFKVFIVSLDLLRNVDWLDKIHAKTIIIDECQLIKNGQSKRTGAVRKLCDGKEHIIALSGTPIKNHAGEYFPILNILRPEMFPRERDYYDLYVDSYNRGDFAKLGGIKRSMVERFNNQTKDFILRYTRDEVMPDLPRINRTFRFSDLGKDVEEEYAKEHAGFERAMLEYELGGDETSTFKKWSNVLAYMTRMRHLTGLA